MNKVERNKLQKEATVLRRQNARLRADKLRLSCEGKRAFIAGYVQAVRDERAGGFDQEGFDEEEENKCGALAFEEWVRVSEGRATK